MLLDMASKNVKPSSVQGLDSPNAKDKMQSSTLKRQPSPDWSKSDLLRLLSYFEGELQARDVAIATLKAEKAKQLLYQAKYGRFGLGDPFIALQRDAEGKNDGGFDEAAIKSMYDNQLAQLENLIATQRKAQLKMREQLGNSEKRFHKLCSELEEEKQKHAQDTAQGDDVTYMLEKERERLKAEIDFEKSQNKKLEKDLKKTLSSLEEERVNAGRHKQVAIMLIKERKHLMERIVAENQLRDEMEAALTDEKSKIQNMAEGLTQESKTALKMEVTKEKQNSKHNSEREALRLRLQEEEKQTNILRAEVSRLSKQLESLQQHTRSSGSSPSGIHVRSSVSPVRPANSSVSGRSGVSSTIVQPISGSTLQPFVVDNTSLEHVSNTTNAVVMTSSADSSATLEFLGPEMASLQQLLATMTTGETNQSGIPLTNAANTSAIQHPTTTTSAMLQTTASPSSETSSNAEAAPQTGSARNALSPFGRIRNAAKKEPNIDAVKQFTSNSKVKITGKVTAQVSPIMAKPSTNSRPVLDMNSSSPSQFLTHHIISPTVTSPSDLSPTPSSKLSSASSNSPVILTCTAASSVHPSTKHRNMPSRARSKSPLKMSHNHARSYSASARISTNTNASAAQHHNTSSWFLSASSVPSLRLSPTTEVHGSPVHHVSTLGHVDALHKILLQKRGDANKTLNDGTTPLHCAVESNQEESVKVLLECGARPSSMRDDRVTPLHMAALRGYSGCVHLLLNKGAAVNVSTTASQVPLHLSVKAGHTESCQLLLKHGANILSTGQDGLTSLHYAVQNNHPEIVKELLDRLRLTGITRESDAAHQIVAMTDKDGYTITHMAAQLPKQDCLALLTESLPLDFDAKDKLGRSVKMIASLVCKELIPDTDKPSGSMARVVVELRNIQENTTVSTALLGVMEVGPGIGWRMMEDRLRGTLNSYLNQLDVGLKTRRIQRLDAELDPAERDFTLGLAMTNIKHFEIGFYKWTPGMQTDMSPYMMLSNSEHKKVTITVDDSDNMCELIAFDVLHPVSTVSNYLRLLDQYKSVIFYGPTGSGKSYLAHRLAQSIAAQELSLGRKPAIHQLSLQPGYTCANFLTFLKQRNCIVPVDHAVEKFAAIVLLDNLETVDIAKLFGELLDPIEYRGKGHTFCIRGDSSLGNSGMHYLADHFYIIGTMNKSRSLGVDLSILPRFRWIQFRLDTEPLRGLLARHFLRRIFNMYHGCMPSPEDPVFRAVEWTVCVWQRLNDSLNKLGIPEVIQGPCMFFKCPLEKQDHKLILEWMQNTWNQQIAPRVRDAVKYSTGSEAPSDSQQKVANTALFVIMQRSVIPSCPLSGPDKDAYFSGFTGSNELDIPLKSRQSRPKGTPLTTLNSPRNSDLHRRPNSFESSPRQNNSLMNERENCQSSPSLSGSAFRAANRNGKEENHTDMGIVTSNIKRRSLSDSSVNKAAQDKQLQYLDGIQSPTSSQAKMAKLEVKSPKMVNIVSAFRSPSQSPSFVPETSPSAAPLKKTGRVSPLLTLVANSPHVSQKKSRSSENISGSSLYAASSGRLRSPGPFSFSLATPTSGLNSFKFFDTSSHEGGESFAAQMPDFSVFEKVPTPTEEFPPNHSFVFVGKSDVKGQTLHDLNVNRKKDEEVWSKRHDVFKPIGNSREEDQRVLESET